MAMAGQVILAIVIGLMIGALLGVLIWKIWMVRHRSIEKQAEKARSEAQYTQILDSLEVLCRVVNQKQVELSEAAIRISALLDYLPEDVSPKVDVSDIHQFAQICQQFDRGDTRQGLTARARHSQDNYRWQLEEEQAAVVGDAVQRLVTVLPSWRSVLLSSSSR
ncbi:MAG: DUF2489 domain-containing protein [Thalassolituus sp.]|jgi:hypothetical protein